MRKNHEPPSTAQFGHDSFLVRLSTETVQKLTQGRDLCEKPIQTHTTGVGRKCYGKVTPLERV